MNEELEVVTLADALPREIERVRKIEKVYRDLGQGALLVAEMIKVTIEEAEKATAVGDTVGMLVTYQALLEYEDV